MSHERPRDDLIIGEHYYILASSVAADLPKLVLKHDTAFLVADRRGDFPNIKGEFGFYVDDTRFLSLFELRLHGQRGLMLNAGLADDALEAAIDLTNPDVSVSPTVVLPGRSTRLLRRLTILGPQLYQWLAIEGFVQERHDLELTLTFAADFVDVFEVRGHPRTRRGQPLPARVDARTVRLGYRGLDDVVRTTLISFDPPPAHLDQETAEYRLTLAPRERLEIGVVVTAVREPASATVRTLPFHDAAGRRRSVVDRLDNEAARIRTNHDRFDHWLTRSRHDLHLLLTETPEGFVPDAGIPWYVAPFGRDALITSFQALPFEPEIARGVLRYFARHQGAVDDAFTDQEPGKIFHELRRGEMASCREIPFIPYYGTVDATPLYVMLAAEYLRWTDDLDFAREIWPAVDRALTWMERAGAAQGAGYLAYIRRSPVGLVNQGWKDSYDSVMHADGRLAEPPIALAEVQGYYHAALRGAAVMAEAIGREGARELRARARRLQERFEADFWMPDEAFYALALDADGAPCRVISSNPGHLLWSGTVSDSRAQIISRRLMEDDMFSGWGIRTLSTRERLYNPMSYHNGSVWPHDTALAATGMRAYGLTSPFVTLAGGLFETVLQFEHMRMPELFCGFARVPGLGPTRYPVACSPQAWAAGVAFQLVSAMLGLRPDAAENQLTLARPTLPGWLTWIELRGLRVAKSRLALRVSQGSDSAAVELLARDGDAELVVRR